MNQKLIDFKEDVEALVKQYWGDDVKYHFTCNFKVLEVRHYGSNQIVIIIEDYEKIHGITQ